MLRMCVCVCACMYEFVCMRHLCTDVLFNTPRLHMVSGYYPKLDQVMANGLTWISVLMDYM